MSENGQNKQVSNDDLARMIADGFADTASKSDIAELKDELKDHDKRLGIVENKLDQALYHEAQRVDKLEQKMDVVYDKLGLPKAA
jgi:ethanolamine ammonia-lyase small subunit